MRRGGWAGVRAGQGTAPAILADRAHPPPRTPENTVPSCRTCSQHVEHAPSMSNMITACQSCSLSHAHHVSLHRLHRVPCLSCSRHVRHVDIDVNTCTLTCFHGAGMSIMSRSMCRHVRNDRCDMMTCQIDVSTCRDMLNAHDVMSST